MSVVGAVLVRGAPEASLALVPERESRNCRNNVRLVAGYWKRLSAYDKVGDLI